MSHPLPPLHLAQKRYANQARLEIERNVLARFEPVDQLAAEMGQWFASLSGIESDTTELRHALWRARTSLQLTLLPFGADELALAREFEAVVASARFYPTLAERASRLRRMADLAIQTAENPKRTTVFGLIRKACDAGENVALLTALTRGRVPGWPLSIIEELRKIFPDLRLITGAASLENDAFDRIVIPGGARLCPLLAELAGGGHGARLSFIAYRGEGIRALERRGLPAATFTRNAGGSRAPVIEAVEEDPGVALSDAWIQERFWQSAREEMLSSAAPGERTLLVRGRLVILANAWKTFLDDDSKVLELSEILVGGTGATEAARRLPRCKVSRLRPGHLVALRTSRSGDYLVSLADALLRKAGKPTLRADATEWKSFLAYAIVDKGTAHLNRILAEKGHEIEKHRYMEMWTTQRIIRPESEELFTALVEAIAACGHLPPGSDAAVAARRYSAGMRELIRFHHIAGIRIRESLLRRLRSMIDSGETIEDELSVRLDGVDAGEITLYRVSDVDAQAIDVPYTQLEVLRPLER